MNKKKMKFLSVIMAIIMIAVMAPVTNMGGMLAVKASAASYSGSWSGGVSWSYNTSNSTLTVSGSGNMGNSSGTNSAWTSYRVAILSTIAKHATKIVVNDGVTGIGDNAFRGLSNITEATLPNSVTSIGQSAFEGCSALTSVTLTSSLKSIGAYAFKSTKFANITIPDSVTSIGNYAFDNISGVTVTCNYNTAAFAYCSANNIKFKIPKNILNLKTAVDAKAKTVSVTAAIVLNKGSTFEGGNFVMTYDPAIVTPVSTDYSCPDMDVNQKIITAIVYPTTGIVNFAVMAPTSCTDDKKAFDCVFATVVFNISSQADNASFSMESTTLGLNNAKSSIDAASSSIELHSYTEAVTKEATCNAEGVITHTCSICSKQYTESIAINSANHVGGTEVKNAKAATCTENGYTGDTVCKGCGAVITAGSDIAANGHSFGEWTVSQVGSCAQDGIESRTCSVCNTTETRTSAATEHTVVVDAGKAATCTEDGITEGSHCSVCGTVIKAQDVIPATGHSFGEWTVKTANTCTVDGVESRICSVCGAEETRTAPATGHNFGEWTVKTANTCTDDGVEVRTCPACGTEESRTIPATGHNFGEWTVKTEKTCTVDGVEVRTCSVCGIEETRTTPATGHDFGEWTVKTEKTCTVDGVEARTCSACGTEETRAIPAGHEFTDTVIEATCTEGGYTLRSCPLCGIVDRTNETAALGHDYDENGVCKRCGASLSTSVNVNDGSQIKVDNDNKTIASGSVLTVSDIKSQISNSNNSYSIIGADGKPVNDDSAPLATGSQISLSNGTSYFYYVLGDVNMDGKVTSSDARLTLRNSAKLEDINSIQYLAANVNGDDKITSSDARTILRVSAKLQSFD